MERKGLCLFLGIVSRGPQPGMRIFLFYFIVLSSCFVFHFCLAGDNLAVRGSMYGDAGFEQEKYNFSPYETFYAVFDFFRLQAGEYTLTTDWITPTGELERQSHYRFRLNNFYPVYRVYFWLQLKARSHLQQLVGGGEFQEKFFGEWRVVVYLNGEPAGEQKFRVN